MRVPCAYFLASPYHIDRWKNILGRLVDVLRDEGVFYVDRIIVGLQALDVLQSLNPYLSSSIPMLILLTGGTSSLALRLIEKFYLRVPVIVVSFDQENSLSSALALTSKASKNGISFAHYHIKTDSMFDQQFRKSIRFLKSICDLYDRRVAILGTYVPSSYQILSNLFGMKFTLISIEEFERSLDSISEDDVRLLVENLPENIIDLFASLDDRLKRLAVCLYKLMVKKGVSIVALDCYSMIDYLEIAPCIIPALLNSMDRIVVCNLALEYIPLALFVNRFAGPVYWLANLCAYDKNKLYFSHCYAPLNLCEGFNIVSHFETNVYGGIEARLYRGTYTIVCVDKYFEKIIVLKGMGEPSTRPCSTCTTKLEVSVNVEDYLDEATNNYHLLLFGDYVDDIVNFAKALRMQVVKYG